MNLSVSSMVIIINNSISAQVMKEKRHFKKYKGCISEQGMIKRIMKCKKLMIH